MAARTDLQSNFNFGPFAVVPERNLVTWEDNESHLEPKQMKALVALARHQPGVVSKQMLIDEVWDGRNTSDESITGCIKGLRSALDNDSPKSPRYVETIHGRGYRLMVPVVTGAEPSANVEIPRSWLPGLLAVIALAVGITYFFFRADPPSSSPQIDSVVITRFANMSTEASQPMVDGFTEQLVSTLYELPDLTIKKGNLPNDSESARDIADRYDVGWVVFGNVMQMGGQVKISARIDDRDSVVEWADSFTGTDEELFDLHEQVATAIRDKIRGEEDVSVTASSKPATSEAYDKYLLGQFYLAKRDIASLRQAVAFLEEAIAMDRDYGPAYLDLANTYLLLADYSAREAMLDLAIATVVEGASRDPQIYDAAQTVHGYVSSKRGDWMAATAAFDIATNSVVEYPVSHHYHSILLAEVGRIDASLGAAIRAREMEPHSQVLNSRLAIAYFWKNDMENARRYYDIANTMGPGAPISQLSYALFLVRDGRIDEAREFVRRAMQLLNIDSFWVDPIFDELKGPLPSAALSSLLMENAARGTIPPNVLLTFWALAGQPDQAIDIAWRLVDDPGLLDIELIYLEEFKGLRQHEDFARFTEQLGLQSYWDNVGCLWTGDQLHCPND
jgi:DNA-binding winged helix-turn-helix (wHTH) protein/TolB-like protein